MTIATESEFYNSQTRGKMHVMLTFLFSKWHLNAILTSYNATLVIQQPTSNVVLIAYNAEISTNSYEHVHFKGQHNNLAHFPSWKQKVTHTFNLRSSPGTPHMSSIDPEDTGITASADVSVYFHCRNVVLRRCYWAPECHLVWLVFSLTYLI